MTQVPAETGYYFPAEWVNHAATWLSYPHNESSWPGKIHTIFPFYNEFIKELAKTEQVKINVLDAAMKQKVERELEDAGVDMNCISFYLHRTNDAWSRDHGPAFLLNRNEPDTRAVINWEYNGWGGKYDADLDNNIPEKVAEIMHLPVFTPGIVMEGGAIDVNGNGTLLTTSSCLLHPNRNPHLNRDQIEKYLMDYYGVQQVLWLGDGIDGDDTDGHIDDITRFVNEDTVITMVENNKDDANYIPLKENINTLTKFRLLNGRQLNIVELPMPEPLYYEGQRLPASYANFYISNRGVIVPTYRCKQDDLAIKLLSECFADRPVFGIDSTEIIWGLGSWHCLSQQEPAMQV